MNQSELITHVAEITGESKKSVEAVLKTTGDVVAAELCGGGEVALPGIGKLQAKDKPARPGRNPKTGETLTIAAHRAPVFSASKALKDAVNS